MVADIQQRHDEVAALCRRFGVRRLELFGSAAGDRYRADGSDLDFLVEFESAQSPGYSDRYFGFLDALQELFGRPVDLVVEAAITNPYFRESVDATRTLLYAA
jgi:predicted nucleotidyltransferase